MIGIWRHLLSLRDSGMQISLLLLIPTVTFYLVSKRLLRSGLIDYWKKEAPRWMKEVVLAKC